MEYYIEYQNTRDGFNRFHNEVINTPRPNFTGVGFDHLNVLAQYLLVFNEHHKGRIFNYKEIFEFFLDLYSAGELNINEQFEDNYFKPYVHVDIDQAYGDKGIGRMFRHEMGIAAFFELIESESKIAKRINVQKCQEIITTPDELLDDLKRNTMLSLQINTNPYMKEIAGIKNHSNTNYRPSFTIIKYINDIGRSVTDFELAILLGRVDRINSQEEILDRALDIGRNLPLSKDDQINYFFEEMGWINSDFNVFTYKASQEPHFKFRLFLLYMVDFGLLEIVNERFILTNYSKNLIDDDLDPYIIDLNNLLQKIEQIENPSSIIDSILNSRTLTLQNLMNNQDDLVYKLGLRSIKEREIMAKAGNNKIRRNSLIMFFAKHLQDHTCMVTTSFENNTPTFHYDTKTFETGNGKYYSEGHHILELFADQGPDIIENIILLDPNTHKLIHNGTPEIVFNFYSKLRYEGVLTVSRFEDMIRRYNCLNRRHLDNLLNKGAIDQDGYDFLNILINDLNS